MATECKITCIFVRNLFASKHTFITNILYGITFYSGFDGTMRLWNNELSLETTLLFYKSTQMYGNDLNGELISKLAWSPSGLCIAASMEGTLNIYTVQRRQYFHL